MKSPAQLAAQLTRQWHSADWRDKRLLGDADAWPITLPIGLPPAAVFAAMGPELRLHRERWLAVEQQGLGEVVWQDKQYRSGATPVRLPTHWRLHHPADWAKATSDSAIVQEWQRVQAVLGAVDPVFQHLLVRRLALWCECTPQQVITATRIARQLAPGCAMGRPLRSLAFQEAGQDSKFFERHEALLKALLDERFDGAASCAGLAAFLGALEARDHWLLVVPLAPGVLPFPRLRLSTADLPRTPLPATRILVVENEQALHLLPRPVPGTIAILGAGLDLDWLAADWLQACDVAYWGDLDTWGMAMLAHARAHLPALRNLLMDRATFDAHAALAVAEPVPALTEPPGLTPDEQALAAFLQAQPQGRLEQEFITPQHVVQAISAWLGEPMR